MKTSNLSRRNSIPQIIYFTLFMFCCCFYSNASAQYSGEALFRAIYFGEGSAASIIPELQGMSIDNFTNDSREQAETRDLQNQIVSKINQIDAGFFNKFGGIMTSKQHVNIRNSLNEGKAMLNDAASQLGFKKDAEFEAQLTREVMANIPANASFESTNQALKDYFQQRNSNSDPKLSLGGYIHHYFVAFIMMAYEWWWDASEEFSVAYQDRLVSSIVNKW